MFKCRSYHVLWSWDLVCSRSYIRTMSSKIVGGLCAAVLFMFRLLWFKVDRANPYAAAEWQNSVRPDSTSDPQSQTLKDLTKTAANNGQWQYNGSITVLTVGCKAVHTVNCLSLTTVTQCQLWRLWRGFNHICGKVHVQQQPPAVLSCHRLGSAGVDCEGTNQSTGVWM